MAVEGSRTWGENPALRAGAKRVAEGRIAAVYSYEVVYFFDGGKEGFEIFGAEELEVVDQLVHLVNVLAHLVIFRGEPMRGLVGAQERRGDGAEELHVGEFGFGVGVLTHRIEQGGDAPFAEIVGAGEDIG